MEVENPFFESSRVVPSCHDADTVTAEGKVACFDGGTTNVVSGRRKSDCEWPEKSRGLKGEELLRKRAFSLGHFKQPVPLVAGNDADFKKEPIPPPPEENGGLPRKLSFLSQMIRGSSSSTSLQDACSSQDGDLFKASVFVEGELTTSPVEFDISRSSNIEFLIVSCLRKYDMEKRIPRLDNSRLSMYSLRVAEEDGSIDTDFPVLAKNQPLENFTHIRQFVLCVGQHYDVPSPKTVPRTRSLSGVKSGDPDLVQVVNTKKSQQVCQRNSLLEMDKRWSHGMVMRPSGSPNMNSAGDVLKNYLKRLCFGAQIGSSPP